MAYPLAEDPTNEDWSSVANRAPMNVEILSGPAALAVTEGLSASMIVLLGTGLATTITTAVARGGAKGVKVFDSAEKTMEYAAKTFRFPGQRVIGGEEGPGAEVRRAYSTRALFPRESAGTIRGVPPPCANLARWSPFRRLETQPNAVFLRLTGRLSPPGSVYRSRLPRVAPLRVAAFARASTPMASAASICSTPRRTHGRFSPP